MLFIQKNQKNQKKAIFFFIKKTPLIFSKKFQKSTISQYSNANSFDFFP